MQIFWVKKTIYYFSRIYNWDKNDYCDKKCAIFQACPIEITHYSTTFFRTQNFCLANFNRLFFVDWNYIQWVRTCIQVIVNHFKHSQIETTPILNWQHLARVVVMFHLKNELEWIVFEIAVSDSKSLTRDTRWNEWWCILNRCVWISYGWVRSSVELEKWALRKIN